MGERILVRQRKIFILPVERIEDAFAADVSDLLKQEGIRVAG